jgi:hypothetical protein
VPIWGVDMQIVGEVYTVTANNELWVSEMPRPPWPFLSRDRIGTEDRADLIEYTIEPDAVSRDEIEFVLTLGDPHVRWQKEILLHGDGVWTGLVVDGDVRSSRKVLPARHLHNGLKLSFYRRKNLGTQGLFTL